MADFDYTLPPEAIAQEPVEPRDASRLLVLHRGDGRLEHRIFRELPQYLRPGDVLVVNESRVRPARLVGGQEGTGGVAELLLLRPDADGAWEWPAPAGGSGRAGGWSSAAGNSEPRCCPADPTARRGSAGSGWSMRAPWTRSWRLWGRCRSRPTSTGSWPTPSGTRRSTPRNRGPQRPPPLGSTSRRGSWSRSRPWGWRWCPSSSMWGWTPSGPSPRRRRRHTPCTGSTLPCPLRRPRRSTGPGPEGDGWWRWGPPPSAPWSRQPSRPRPGEGAR